MAQATLKDEFLDMARQYGGVTFTLAILLVSIFVFALFNLRADKIFTLPGSIQTASTEDLVAFWRAAQLAIEGSATSAYNAEIFKEPFTPLHEGLLWLNPPHMLFVLIPLALLPYGVAKFFWIAISLLSLVAIVLITAPRSAPIETRAPLFVAGLLSPAAFASLLVLQTGPMIAAALTGALLISDRRPILAGVLLALVTMKPQFGLLVPIFLGARGEWRAFTYAAVFSAFLIGASFFFFGLETWGAFFHSVMGGEHAAHAERLHRDMLTAHQTIGKLGGGSVLRTGGQAVLMIGAGLGVFFSARHWPRDTAIATTLLLGAIASPSLWVYDWPLIMAGLLMLMRSSAPWPIHIQIAGIVLWVAPLIPLGLANTQSAVAASAFSIAAILTIILWLNRQHPRSAKNYSAA